MATSHFVEGRDVRFIDPELAKQELGGVARPTEAGKNSCGLVGMVRPQIRSPRALVIARPFQGSGARQRSVRACIVHGILSLRQRTGGVTSARVMLPQYAPFFALSKLEKSVARQVDARAGLVDDEVVFDANASKGFQRVNEFPVDQGTDRTRGVRYLAKSIEE